MKLSYSETPRADYEASVSTIVDFLKRQPKHRGQYIPCRAATIADVIWPTHKMKEQGAGGAASRVLKRMEKQGLVRWTSTSENWGWVLN